MKPSEVILYLDKEIERLNDECRQTMTEIANLRTINADFIAALEQIVELAHYPDESIARAAIDKAKEASET